MKPSIETSSFCNLKCQMCPYQHKPIERGFMDWDLFTKLVDELAPQSEAIHIFNRGEPFTYPQIYEAIDYVHSKGKPVIIASNALLMIVEKVCQHLKPGDLLVISCHAGNSETYKEITGTGGFEEAKKNIFYLRDNLTEGVDFRVKLVKQPQNNGQEEVLKSWGVRVDVCEDSNQPNPHGYEDCGQPDVCPTWDFKGNKKVCCRDEFSEHDFDTYYAQAKKRELNICKGCAIH